LQPTTLPLPGKWANLLLEAALSLHGVPERGRMVPELRWSELHEIIFRSYRIIYRLKYTDKSVEIVRFWPGARRFPQIPTRE
jgi:plasmid stabilization system protein ParE